MSAAALRGPKADTDCRDERARFEAMRAHGVFIEGNAEPDLKWLGVPGRRIDLDDDAPIDLPGFDAAICAAAEAEVPAVSPAYQMLTGMIFGAGLFFLLFFVAREIHQLALSLFVQLFS